MTASYTVLLPRRYADPQVAADEQDYRMDPASYSDQSGQDPWLPLLPPCERGQELGDLVRFAMSEQASELIVRTLGLGALPPRLRAAVDRAVSLDLLCGDKPISRPVVDCLAGEERISPSLCRRCASGTFILPGG